jgi:hypothetical protein
VGHLLALIKINHLEVDFSTLQEPQRLEYNQTRALPPPGPKRHLQRAPKDAKRRASCLQGRKPRAKRGATGVSVICDALKDGPLCSADLRLAFLVSGLKDSGISGRIYDAEKQGLIKRVGRGLYQLMEPAGEQVDAGTKHAHALGEHVAQSVQHLGEMLDDVKSESQKRIRLIGGSDQKR